MILFFYFYELIAVILFMRIIIAAKDNLNLYNMIITLIMSFLWLPIFIYYLIKGGE